MSLNKTALGSITFAAFVMAAIDGFMDDDEISAINAFTLAHWSPDFGSLEAFMREVDDQIVGFFELLDGKNIEDPLFEDILPQMNAEEKQALTELMVDVMQADGVLEDAELELLERLKRA